MGGTLSSRIAITTVLASRPAMAASFAAAPAHSRHHAFRAAAAITAHRRLSLTTMAEPLQQQQQTEQSKKSEADIGVQQARPRKGQRAPASSRKQNLYGLRDEQLASVLEDWGEKKFRLKQIKGFIYGDSPAESIDDATLPWGCAPS